MRKIVLYHMKAYVRINKAGDIDLDYLKNEIREIGQQITAHPDHDILLDSRLGAVQESVYGHILEILMEMLAIIKEFPGKIANILPPDKQRMAFSNELSRKLQAIGIQYRAFIDYEGATDWLSETTVLEE